MPRTSSVSTGWTEIWQRMRRQGCQRKWEERLVRETAHTSTNSNTQTIMGSYEIQCCESNLQAWNLVPNASGSRTWPKEEIEQSVDLSVDGISHDETYKDKQYMQRIAEQVQKLVTAKEILKYHSLKDNILSEQAVKKIHEVGNCELQSQRCYSYIEAGFQVCPCGGQLNMSEEMFSASYKIFSNSLQMPT